VLYWHQYLLLQLIEPYSPSDDFNDEHYWEVAADYIYVNSETPDELEIHQQGGEGKGDVEKGPAGSGDAAGADPTASKYHYPSAAAPPSSNLVVLNGSVHNASFHGIGGNNRGMSASSHGKSGGFGSKHGTGTSSHGGAGGGIGGIGGSNRGMTSSGLSGSSHQIASHSMSASNHTTDSKRHLQTIMSGIELEDEEK
jgi:hypothetical protein